MQYLDAISKMTVRSVCFQCEPFNSTVIQVYAQIGKAEEAEQFYEDLQDLLELTSKKGIILIVWDWNAKAGVKKHQE